MNNDGSICIAHAQNFFRTTFLYEFKSKELFKLLIFWSVNEILHFSQVNLKFTSIKKKIP